MDTDLVADLRDQLTLGIKSDEVRRAMLALIQRALSEDIDLIELRKEARHLLSLL